QAAGLVDDGRAVVRPEVARAGPGQGAAVVERVAVQFLLVAAGEVQGEAGGNGGRSRAADCAAGPVQGTAALPGLAPGERPAVEVEGGVGRHRAADDDGRPVHLDVAGAVEDGAVGEGVRRPRQVEHGAAADVEGAAAGEGPAAVVDGAGRERAGL